MGISSKSSIKGVQRGSITMSGGGISAAATIAAVNPAKAEVRLLGYEADNTAGGAVNYALARLELTNATTITARRVVGIGQVVVGYEVTEWA